MTAQDLRATEARAVAGDPDAFGQLIRVHDHDLRRVVWSVVRDSDAIDDVMQQAYEKAFVGLAAFNGQSAMKTWLHAICYRTAIDHVRYEGHRRHDDIAKSDVTDRSPAVSDAAATREELRALLNGLDPQQRALLLMTAGLGYSYDEVAEVTGDKRGTIASRVSRARQKIARW